MMKWDKRRIFHLNWCSIGKINMSCNAPGLSYQWCFYLTYYWVPQSSNYGQIDLKMFSDKYKGQCQMFFYRLWIKTSEKQYQQSCVCKFFFSACLTQYCWAKADEAEQTEAECSAVMLNSLHRCMWISSCLCCEIIISISSKVFGCYNWLMYFFLFSPPLSQANPLIEASKNQIIFDYNELAFHEW